MSQNRIAKLFDQPLAWAAKLLFFQGFFWHFFLHFRYCLETYEFVRRRLACQCNLVAVWME